MALEYLSELAINRFITMALAEDIGEGDHTTNACIPEDAEGKAFGLAKDDGIIAGINIGERIMLSLDSNITFNPLVKDGDDIKAGDRLFEVSGNQRAILQGERLLLNCMQRMSGIATYTSTLKKLIEGSKARLLDTRKTTPNFRLMEKWAVLIGGGTNHRYNLADMVMIKDNHIDFAGGITEAIEKVKTYLKERNLTIGIEVETRNLNEVQEVLSTQGVQRILLDNMTPEQLIEAVNLINGKVETEASGGITEETIAEIAQTGVDFISVGALTHSVKSLDISLKAC